MPFNLNKIKPFNISKIFQKNEKILKKSENSKKSCCLIPKKEKSK